MRKYGVNQSPDSIGHVQYQPVHKFLILTFSFTISKKIESRGDINTADGSVSQYRGLLTVYCRGIQALRLEQSQRAQPLELKDISRRWIPGLSSIQNGALMTRWLILNAMYCMLRHSSSGMFRFTIHNMWVWGWC
jgi:hypothetical protein